jgi:hypothetical protein
LRQLWALHDAESDPAKKRDLLDRSLAVLQEGWNEVFPALAQEENPQKLLLLIDELKHSFELRHSQLKRFKAQSDR